MCSGSNHKCLVGMPADVQADHGISSAYAQCFSCCKKEQTIMTSSNDITTIAHAIGEGVYKKSLHMPWGCHLGFGN